MLLDPIERVPGPFFPDRQIHIVLLEDLGARPKETLDGCFRFLDCDPDLSSVNAAKQLNVSARKSIPTPLGAVLRYLPQRMLARRLRRTLTSLVPSIVERPLSRPVWDTELSQEVSDGLRNDANTFLAHCGKPKDFWDLTL